MDRSFLYENFFKMLELSFFSKLDWGSDIAYIAKSTSKKIGTFFCYMKFILMEFWFIFVNLLYYLAWNTVVMCGLARLAATWICLFNSKNGCLELLVLKLVSKNIPYTPKYLYMILCHSFFRFWTLTRQI